ncbi:hypothetical protein [Clostridium tyrobutyricum]|jgi:hypothetical protein|uniref:hypothetical protein n=1 Tax=Clostridium tyrobutyricum TaxID=1519 RepID=UPI00243062CA|nr:hypothetical protein [Clostridium tyrobutyricum]
MRGRKKKENSNCEVFSIRINKNQKELLKKNDWLKKELCNKIRDYLDFYTLYH